MDSRSSRRLITQQLRELLRRKSDSLNQDALRTEGKVDADELAALERIAKAARLSEEAAGAPSRWWHVAALVLALSLVSVLFLVRVPKTEITLEGEASQMSFVVRAEKPIVERASMAELGVSGVDVVRVSPDTFPELTQPLHDPGATMMRLSVVPESNATGAINTAALIPPPGTRVWLRHTDFARTYRLSLKPPQKGTRIALEADVRGSLAIAAPGRLQKTRNYDFGKSGATVQFESLGEIMDVDFVLADASQLQFYAQLPVESLDLFSIEQFATPQKSLVAPMSTLLAGVLYFDSLDGERHPLRNGEQIRFTVAQGRLESLRLLDDRIAFKFRGRINAISVGDEEARRNLMPSLLQWLRARQPLSLIWGAAIFVYGLLLSGLRWYRSSP